MQVFTLKKRRDFLKAAKEFKVVTNAVILQAALNLSPQPFPCCFVGYTATKKLGKAYIRNKTKRRLRAAVSIVFPGNALNGVNYVIIGRHNTNTLNFNYLVKKLEEALIAINQQISNRENVNDKTIDYFAD